LLEAPPAPRLQPAAFTRQKLECAFAQLRPRRPHHRQFPAMPHAAARVERITRHGQPVGQLAHMRIRPGEPLALLSALNLRHYFTVPSSANPGLVRPAQAHAPGEQRRSANHVQSPPLVLLAVGQTDPCRLSRYSPAPHALARSGPTPQPPTSA